MSKYIVEIKPEYEDSFKGLMILGAKDSNLFVDTLAVDDLEQLNSDYINEHYGDLQDTAYQRGLEEGKKATFALIADASDAEYQRGLDDAWEVAKKVVINPDEGGLSILELNEIFNCTTIQQVFRKYTLSEVIAKLKAYEEKQKTDNCIEIGDEVKWDGNKCIVTNRHIDINMGIIQDYDLMSCEGSVVAHVKRCSFVKTGRHFDIEKILEAMKA